MGVGVDGWTSREERSKYDSVDNGLLFGSLVPTQLSSLTHTVIVIHIVMPYAVLHSLLIDEPGQGILFVIAISLLSPPLPPL